MYPEGIKEISHDIKRATESTTITPLGSLRPVDTGAVRGLAGPLLRLLVATVPNSRPLCERSGDCAAGGLSPREFT